MEREKPQPSPKMIFRGRQLRRQAPVPERLLWGKLRDGRCAGLKFRRQYPVGPYVVDFYCSAYQIVIELDGRSHNGRGAEDVQRQEYLERQGLKVIRFTNDQVLTELKGVVKAIYAVVERIQAAFEKEEEKNRNNNFQ